MRKLRLLKQGVWYHIRTQINNREPLFRGNKALVIFGKVFTETKQRYAFEVLGLSLENDTLEFFIKPDNGLELPAIMKWLKQVFSQRYNHADGRVGHIWGDRYWSLILEGEPPPQAAVVDTPVSGGGSEAASGAVFDGGETGVRPQYRYMGIKVGPQYLNTGKNPTITVGVCVANSYGKPTACHFFSFTAGIVPG